jgi:uncharacterized protein (UPF0218 family)
MTPTDRESFEAALRGAETVVTVGDRVTETVAGLGRTPDVHIVDGLERRHRRSPPRVKHVVSISVRNPPGTITMEAVDGIREAFRGKKPARVLVEGEEDLLAIPAVIFAPRGSVLFYGQPGEGIVMLKIDSKLKARNRELLRRIRSPDVGSAERT